MRWGKTTLRWVEYQQGTWPSHGLQSAVADPGKGPRGRSSQGSPQILAQQVRDHSWTVRQKIYTFLRGGEGGQWSEGHGPALTGKFFIPIF